MALLKQFKSPFGLIRILRDRDGILLYHQNGCYHSQSNARGVSVCAYVHVIQQVICQKKTRKKSPKKVLIVGCGGGTLATMLTRKGCEVTVVDINPLAFTIARDYFRMPAKVQCITQNGLTYIRDTKERFDAVVVDVFDSDNNVPDGFTTKKFFKSAKAILTSGGLILMNVITRNDADTRGMVIAKTIASLGIDTSLYDWPNHKDRNTLIVGGTLSGVTIPDGSEPRMIKQQMIGLHHSQIQK